VDLARVADSPSESSDTPPSPFPVSPVPPPVVEKKRIKTTGGGTGDTGEEHKGVAVV